MSYAKLCSVLASWDSEEYGLVGSTEFGEEHEKEISENCVACTLFLSDNISCF